MTLRHVAATLVLFVLAANASADAWLEDLYAQQRALYRLTGTFYMVTHEDAESDLLAALPVRVAEYRDAMAATLAAAGGNRLHSQQAQAIKEASAPIERLLSNDIQQVIGTEQKKYINNGVFNAFQRANDVYNEVPALVAALDTAIAATGATDARPAVLLRGAVASEAMAAEYARLVSGYFDEAHRNPASPTLAATTQDFVGALDKARAQVNRDDAVQRVVFERVESRWKFVQPTLAKPDSRPRIIYRYLGEISDNFVKLAAAH